MPSRCPVLSRHWVNGYSYETPCPRAHGLVGETEKKLINKTRTSADARGCRKITPWSNAKGLAGQVCTVWTKRFSPGDSVLQSPGSRPHEVGEGLPVERQTAISFYPLAPPLFPLETNSIALRVHSPSGQCLTPQSCKGRGKALSYLPPTLTQSLFLSYPLPQARELFSTLRAVFDVCNVICWYT